MSLVDNEFCANVEFLVLITVLALHNIRNGIQIPTLPLTFLSERIRCDIFVVILIALSVKGKRKKNLINGEISYQAIFRQQ